MAETKTARRPAARKPATARKPTTARKRTTARTPRTIKRTTELSEDVFKSLESGQKAAIEAVRKFVDTVDEKLPAAEHPSKRQDVIDAAMEMSERLVHTQYEFLRKVVHSAGKTLTKK